MLKHRPCSSPPFCVLCPKGIGGQQRAKGVAYWRKGTTKDDRKAKLNLLKSFQLRMKLNHKAYSKIYERSLPRSGPKLTANLQGSSTPPATSLLNFRSEGLYMFGEAP